MADIYDMVFRTVLNDCRHLIIPIINEAFNEHYTGKEHIQFFPNEHFIAKQNEIGDKRVTDTSFTIYGGIAKKYHLECQSTWDSKMLIRLFEYDAQIALDQSDIKETALKVSFPNTAVLYLRGLSSGTPVSYKYILETPGGSISYDIPIIRMQEYTLDEIFEKELFFLIPFYIFTRERYFKEYEENEDKLKELEDEYNYIIKRLDDFVERGKLQYFDKMVLIESANEVIKKITDKYTNIRKGMGDIMVGELLQTKAKTLWDAGRSEGWNEGRNEGERNMIFKYVTMGRVSVEEGAADAHMTVSEFEKAMTDAGYKIPETV